MKLLWSLILMISISGSMGDNPKNISYLEFVEKFREEALERHNLFRKGFIGAEPMVLNHLLCKSSQARADEWAKSQNSTLNDDVPYPFGENTFRIPLTEKVEIYGSTPVDKWYDQIHDYDFSTGARVQNSGSNTENFTQIIWKEVREMCISFAIGHNSKLGSKILYIVANYNPEFKEFFELPEEERRKSIVISPTFLANSEHAPTPKHLTRPITSTTVFQEGPKVVETIPLKETATNMGNVLSNTSNNNVGLLLMISVLSGLSYSFQFQCQ